MARPVLDYTSYDDIRAVLGVSEDEIEDTTLSLSLYEFGLAAEIREVALTLDSDLVIVSAIEADDRTTEEANLYESAYLFSTLSVAKQLLTSLPLFSPKEITDGKASMSRYAANPYEATMKRVESDYLRYKNALTTAYASYKLTTASARSVLVYMGISTPSTNPITG